MAEGEQHEEQEEYVKKERDGAEHRDSDGTVEQETSEKMQSLKSECVTE